MRSRNVSIATLLSVALVGVVTLLLGAFAVFMYSSERDERWTMLRNALSVSADQQAAGLALPMWNLDDRHVRAILTSGMSHREIMAIAATTAGKTYVIGRTPEWSLQWRETEPADGDLLMQERSIQHGGEPVGRVRVFASPRFLQQDLAARLRSLVVLILVLDAAMVASLVLLLWQLMVKPLRAVERFAASVKAGQPGDQAALAVADGSRFHGELHQLAESIREMTAMLDSRYRALQDSEERLQLATRAANIGIWDWDVLRDELVWDEQMYQIYGVARQDFSGAYEAWASALTPEDMRQAQDDVKAALRGERPFATEFTVRRPDGAVRVIKGEAATLRDPQGKAFRMVGVNIDITERKRTEQELERMNAELEQRVHERTSQLEAAIAELARARDQAESATRAKSEFLANMSHEIRTPMNAILGMTDLALRTDLSVKQRGYLAKAKIAANSLLAIINDILDFSKIEAGKLEMENREFLLQEVLDKVTAVVGLKAQEKGLDLLLNTGHDVPPALVGDALRLEQVLINLCTNAVKFTADGEIVVVTVRSVLTDDQRVTLRFSVRDTGVGMTEAQVAGLFQPFNQLDASTTRKYGGTGLGLAICKQLVTLMGGEIDVKSQPGKGSDFFFTASFGIGAAQVPATLEPMPGLRNLRILVVDDSANSREIFQDLLRGMGYLPACASSGPDGLAELERAAGAGRPYDLVLLDWKMPGCDGFELAERIRRSRALARPPRMVMITAYGDEELMRRAVDEHLDGCLAKPVGASNLLDAIMNCFGPDTAPPPASHTAAAGTSAAPALLRGRRVLLVEDNEFNQIVASELLADVAGMHVTLAANGQEAVECVRTGRFEAVLMDVQMPVMDGYQATALVRQHPDHTRVPIIAMTAHAMARDRDKCLAVGMNDYVTKPFDPKELFAVLAKWLAAEPSASEPAPHDDEPPMAAVSFTLGLQRCMGRVELYEKILARFLSARAADPELVQAALVDGDLERASAIAHTMISTAGTLGAEALSEAARALQLGIEAGDIEQLPRLVQAFAICHGEAIMQLRSYLDQHAAAGRG